MTLSPNPSGYSSIDNQHYEIKILSGDPVGSRFELSQKDILRGKVSIKGNTYDLPRCVQQSLGDGEIVVYFTENRERERMDDQGDIQALIPVMEITGIVQLLSNKPKQPRPIKYSFPIDSAIGFTHVGVRQSLGQY